VKDDATFQKLGFRDAQCGNPRYKFHDPALQKQYDEGYDLYRYAEPKWDDGCDHSITEFIGTAFFDGNRPLDIYIYGPEREVCIRYGNEAGMYHSPGQVDRFIERVANSQRGALPDAYYAVYDFITQHIKKGG